MYKDKKTENILHLDLPVWVNKYLNSQYKSLNHCRIAIFCFIFAHALKNL